MNRVLFTVIIAILILSGCKGNVSIDSDTSQYPSLAVQRQSLATKPKVVATRLLDSIQIINDLEFLASDACEGRRPGTAGHARANGMILNRMRATGVDSFSNSLVQTFTGRVINGTTEGKNIIGWLKGTRYPDRYIVLSAHYDHLGKKSNGVTYYGADDNASGVACLLALAKYFKKNRHPYSLVFAALDREETGLEGAYSCIPQLTKTIDIKNIKFNLNMDMIARSDNNEIFACGIKHYPSFRYVVDNTQNKTNVKILMGHDQGSSKDDWTMQSDHAAFHQKKIPFLYIGVEDHPDYHAPTDTHDKINYSNYIENCNMLLLMTQILKP